MSVLVLSVGDDGIIAACDGVCYAYDTGAVCGFVSKIILLPEYGALIAATGAGAFGPALRQEITRNVWSFDNLVDRFEELCSDVHYRLFGCSRTAETEVSCAIAGWSEARQAYEAYRLVSFEKPSVSYSDGSSSMLPPFQRLPLPGAFWSSYSPKNLAEFGLSPIPDDMPADEIAIRLVCAARADSGWWDEGEEHEARHFNAGGFIQFALLRRDSVQSWIAHRWAEDVIGRPINPQTGERLPAHLLPRVRAVDEKVAA